MPYYITEFDIGTDLQQPHNFVKINGMSPMFHSPMKYRQQPNNTYLYEWINMTDFGLNKTLFDSVLTKRNFQNANATTIIINSSTAKLRMEFVKKNLFVKSDNSKRQQFKQSLLILDQNATKPIHMFNLHNGSGELSIFSFISEYEIEFFVVNRANG